MRTTNYKMMNYNVSIPEVDMPIFESLFKKYNVIVKPLHISEPTEEYVPNKKLLKLLKKAIC